MVCAAAHDDAGRLVRKPADEIELHLRDLRPGRHRLLRAREVIRRLGLRVLEPGFQPLIRSGYAVFGDAAALRRGGDEELVVVRDVKLFRHGLRDFTAKALKLAVDGDDPETHVRLAFRPPPLRRGRPGFVMIIAQLFFLLLQQFTVMLQRRHED